MISQYNLDQPEGIKNMMHIMVKRIHVKGFSFHDYHHLYPKFLDTVLPYIKEGKIVYVEDIAEGLESGPAALVGPFKGRNIGKQWLPSFAFKASVLRVGPIQMCCEEEKKLEIDLLLSLSKIF
ncbi:2-alkenal reductase (nadp(+)-dependent) [Quercus suber]|uniref:2-alkenal reductase (Nadp(+)-dependent) n=1 Tax=Quercus suber TaxID=58331 RepID=A0AAW0K1U6_QUESU